MGRSSLTKKVWLLILTCSVVLAVSLYAVLNGYYRRVLLQNAEKQFEYEDQLCYDHIETYTATANSCLNTVILHLNSAMDASDLQNHIPRERTATQKKIYHALLNTFKMFRGPLEVAIVWDNGKFFYQSSDYFMGDGEKELIQQLDCLNMSSKGIWLTQVGGEKLMSGNGLYAVKPYTEIETGIRTGYVILKMDEKAGIFTNADRSRTIYLFSPEEMLIQTSDPSVQDHLLAETGYQARLARSQAIYRQVTTQKYGEEELFTQKKLKNGWQVLIVTSLRETVQSLNKTQLLVFAIAALVMCGMMCAVGSCLHYFVRPIRQLSTYILNTREEELPTAFQGTYQQDEVGVLIENFNQMLEKNQLLFVRVIEEEQKRKELEFSLLQAQIKPHFLYNALDAIYCLNEMGRCKEASSMTKLLSEYYRRALNNGLEKVTLKKEMELTEIYLQIQSVRYPSILSYRMECEKSIEAFEIPKLTLQPLVENAIYHGIKPLGRKGTVTVRAWLEQETVKIRVADNGAGLNAGLFEQCVSKERGSEKGYGLFNFAERLRLCYGDKCTITLEQADEGTSILIAVCGGLRAVNGKETL